MKKILFVLVSFLVLGTTVSAEKAPEVTLPDINGKQVSLSDYKGKVVVVDFWAMWCASCREAFSKLSALNNEYKSLGTVAVVGINLEKAKPAKVSAFSKKAKITYKILLDPKNSTVKLFNIKGVPTLVVIDKEGNMVKTFRGMNKSTEKEVDNLVKELSSK